MVRIAHQFKEEMVSKEVSNNIRILLCNRTGGYFSDSFTKSRYDGFFVYEQSMLKILDSIVFPDAQYPRMITNKFFIIERQFENFADSFFIPHKHNALVYEINAEKEFFLDFDVRESYDLREWGRNYEMFEEDGKYLLKYVKRSTVKEDGKEGEIEFVIYAAIKVDGNVEKVMQWVKKSYEADKLRNSSPWERFVFRALKIAGTKCIMAVDKDREKAKATAEYIYSHLEELKKVQEEYYDSYLGWHLPDSLVSMAFRCALSSLDGLTINDGIFAGFPWFFQCWVRDEAVSLKALLFQKKYKLVKNILVKELGTKRTNGRLANVDISSIASADSTGWFFLRFGQFLDCLTKEKHLRYYFEKYELEDIISQLEKILDSIIRTYSRESLVWNKAQETWMDTVTGNNGREGMRIEIQAMQLRIYDMMLRLTEKKFYNALEKSLHKAVKKRFWNGKFLFDGISDETIRPNLFIAAYFYPKLLDKSEWTKCFEFALERLWLEWGGLSTIDKNNPLFQPNHTGQNPASYHHGDSWFWINNLAALVMSKINKEKFSLNIRKILDASTEEILFSGAIGHHAELSSASALKSEGAWSQAWSNAMYVELVEEMFF